MRSKKTQITVFLIIGIIVAIVVISVVLLTRYSARKTSNQETIEVQESALDVRPIKGFVEGCLSVTSKEGLKKLGKQGGRLFLSQGGPVPDYISSQEGLLFINYQNSNVAYNIVKPTFSEGKYSHIIPDYPWDTFPLEDGAQNYRAEGVFGTNKLPPLNKSFTQKPMQEQLETYVSNNIDNCLNFYVFEEQGFEITKGNNSISVAINQNDVVFRMQHNITINNLITGERTDLKEFFVRQNIRLGRIHEFVNKLIEEDIGDISFNITSTTFGQESFNVNVIRNASNKDDIIVVVDERSVLDNFPYNYVFARKNRNPALFSSLLHIGTEIALQEITIDELYATGTLEALDPDEDLISKDSFSISPTPSGKYKVTVTDNELEDYTEVTLITVEI